MHKVRGVKVPRTQFLPFLTSETHKICKLLLLVRCAINTQGTISLSPAEKPIKLVKLQRFYFLISKLGHLEF